MNRREMTTGEAAAWDAGYAAGLNAARFADPRWCIADKNTACASRDCTAEWCARRDGPADAWQPIDGAVRLRLRCMHNLLLECPSPEHCQAKGCHGAPPETRARPKQPDITP